MKNNESVRFAPESGYNMEPLVFFSASYDDSEWCNRLKAQLDALYIGESHVPTGPEVFAGDDFPDDIALQIGQSRIGVILLSPKYMQSQYCMRELDLLVKGSKPLFLIVLRQCNWKEMELLNGIQAWSDGKPIAELDANKSETELKNIAISIAEMIKDKKTDKPITKFDFSTATEKLLKRAMDLKKKSKRGGVTTSCLLFAIAESEDNEDEENTIHFFQERIKHNKIKYSSEYDEFLRNSELDRGRGLDDGGSLLGKVSRNTLDLLNRAKSNAIKVSREKHEIIYLRHLLAALFETPDSGRHETIPGRLKRLEIKIPELLHEFREFIFLHKDFGEDTEAWNNILGSIPGTKPIVSEEKTSDGSVGNTVPDPFVEGTAGYTSEFCGLGGYGDVPDHLGVEKMAQRLAELIACRETKLPLAIGLFGNWGSGKSYFMNIMDRNIMKLSHEPNGQWCKIVPIYFNAWHYIDTNLWASLVSHIFDGLFSHLGTKKITDIEEVRKLLKDASGATARAEKEVEIAQAVTEVARRDFETANKERLDCVTNEYDLLNALRELLSEEDVKKLKDEIRELPGVQKTVENINELRELSTEVSSLLGHIRMLWNYVLKPDGRKMRITYFILAVIAAALPYIAEFLIPTIKELFNAFYGSIAKFVTGASALFIWIRPILKESKKQLTQIEDLAKKAEAAQIKAKETPQYLEAKMNVEAAKTLEESAKIRLEEAKRKECQLIEEERSLSPGQRLGRFIEQRAQSSDYRGQLGLVSLARRDFQELSDLFANDEALNKKLNKLKANDKSEKPNSEVKQIIELSKSIDRIVLYVDDLDRCQPDKVVDVLQAVHLLLAFPLFAVVVGVDQRCLKQSLRIQFKGLLTPELETGQENGQSTSLDFDKDERPATPLDYLEKIFHIPFHLPPMSRDGFSTLIEKLSEPPPSKTPTEEESNPKVLPKSINDIAPAVTDSSSEASKENPTGKTQSDWTLENNADEMQPQPLRQIGSVPLEMWERIALKDYHALIHTPRGATRLLNTYRLVRAGIPYDEWNIFCGDKKKPGEFRIAMLLLATAAGYPAVVHQLFDRLRELDQATPLITIPLGQQNDSKLFAQAWEQFKKTYDDTCGQAGFTLTKDLLEKWLNDVERFTF
jgi:hypothetical protein